MAYSQTQAVADINTEKATVKTQANLDALIASYGQASVQEAVVRSYLAGLAFAAVKSALVDTIA